MARRSRAREGILFASVTSMLVAAGSPAGAQPTRELERVEITGSAIRRIAGEAALPVLTLRREDIERSGATSTADLIQQLPSMQRFTNEGASVGGGGNGFSGASIHNLGETRTLVLLNGRRLAPFAGQTLTGELVGIDLNTIPLAAIERIEVLSDGASSIYGADAIGGVVNFVTRRNAQAGDITVGASAPADGAREKRVSFTKGFGSVDADGFNLTLTANLDKRSRLRARDRDFARTGMIDFELDGRDVMFFTGSPRAAPGNVTHDAGTPDDPSDDFLVNPYLLENGECPPKHRQLDQTCYYDFMQDTEILPERERAGFMAQFDLRLAPEHTLYAELLAARTTDTNRLAPQGGELAIGPDSPFWSTVLSVNPAATDASIVPYRAADVGQRVSRDRTDVRHFVLGVEGSVGPWTYDSALVHSVNKQATSLRGGWVRQNAFIAALESGLVNPFVLPGNQSPAGQQALDDAQILGFFEGGESTLDSVTLRGSREVAALPGGPLAMAAGVSYMRERFRKKASDLAQGIGDTRFGDAAAVVPYDADRHATALFAEVVAPVSRAVELTTSARHDRYSDFGSATTAKLSARYQPTATLLLRGSVGSGFKAPSVPQVNAVEQEYGSTGAPYTCTPALQQVAAELGAVCPAGNVQYDVRAAGNPDLKPERSRQWSLGFRVEPTPWLSFGADLWEVRLKNSIGQVDETTVFGDPLAWRSQFTTFTDPVTGEVRLAFLADNRNLGRNIQRGIDFDVRTRNSTPIGRLSTHLGVSYWLKDRYQLQPGGPMLSSLGRYGPNGAVTFRWQGRFLATLERGAVAHTLGVNFQSGYRDQRYAAEDFVVFDPQTFEPFGYEGRVKAQATVDWQTAWTMTQSFKLRAGILNVFDAEPRRSLKTTGGGLIIGYDDRYFDPRGRTLYASLSYVF
jgi:iron complex outermembrane receptor protein